MIQMIMITIGITPAYNGKVLIQYNSHNQDFIVPEINKTWIQEVELIERRGYIKPPCPKKSFLLKFKDFKEEDILLCLSTKEIFSKYLEKKDGWNVIKNEILWDNENLFLVGEFEPSIPIHENDLLEKYKYFVTIEFGDKKKAILNFLNKERLNEDIANDFKMPL